MRIVDFLIANYHWILAIILLTIITIIGFLVDKKKNDKKKQEETTKPQENNNDITINKQPMKYQPEIQSQMNQQQNMVSNNTNNITNGTMNSNLNIKQNQNNFMNQTNNNPNIGTIPQTTIPTMVPQNNNMINVPQSVENIAPAEKHEPMYQPLEEQKPHFAPQQVQNVELMQQQPISMGPQMMNNSISFGNQNMINLQNQNVTIPSQIQSAESLNQITNYNQNNDGQEKNNVILNVIPNQGTVPQSVNPVPVPQPVMPQQIMPNQMQRPELMGQMQTYNINQSMPNGFVPNQNPQNLNMPQQSQQQPMSPINFVYGPQNNNQNM